MLVDFGGLMESMVVLLFVAVGLFMWLCYKGNNISEGFAVFTGAMAFASFVGAMSFAIVYANILYQNEYKYYINEEVAKSLMDGNAKLHKENEQMHRMVLTAIKGE